METLGNDVRVGLRYSVSLDKSYWVGFTLGRIHMMTTVMGSATNRTWGTPRSKVTS